MSWTLVIIAFNAGVMNIAGYASYESCEKARAQFTQEITANAPYAMAVCINEGQNQTN